VLCVLLASGILAIVITGERVTGGGPSGFTTLTAGLLLIGLVVLLACTFDRSVPRHVGFLPYPRWVEVAGMACAVIAVGFLALTLISALVTSLRTIVVVLLVVDTVLASIGAFLALPPADFR
jgi:hypothetical protein